jgi:hypothetical protein
MGFHFLVFNKRQNSVYVYYQLCPSCKEPFVGIYESQKLELMPPVTPDDINNVDELGGMSTDFHTIL